MRLLSTGRVVRAARNSTRALIEPRRPNSTNASASEDQQRLKQQTSYNPVHELPIRRVQPPDLPLRRVRVPDPPLRRVKQFFSRRNFTAVDIHPSAKLHTVEEDPFKAFLLEKQEPNTVIRRDADSGVVISSRPYKLDATSNLSPSVLNLIDRRLYVRPDHPLSITRKLIESVFPKPTYENYIATDPVVTTVANFDGLGFAADHPGRSATDTYYVNRDHVLRTHTSAHEQSAFRALRLTDPACGYTICADVFRRDSIDRTHFPVFHQMEGARMWPQYRTDDQGRPISPFQGTERRLQILRDEVRALGHTPVDAEDPNPTFDHLTNPKQRDHLPEETRLIATHLKRSLEWLVAKVIDAAKTAGIAAGHLKPEVAKEALKARWVEAYFPNTSPSWELEVFWQGEWLELLGCGVVQQDILIKTGVGDRIGWAWGLGVERLAMLLFGIPDIRLFWSEDPRFLNQFQEGTITRYEPFSKYPACYKDVAFWINSSPAAASPLSEPTHAHSGVAAAAGGDATKASPAEGRPAAFHENDVMEIVRDVAGSLAEDVKLIDEFVHPTTGRKSLCYRVNYRSLERTLTNEETNRLHEEIARRLVADLGVELR